MHSDTDKSIKSPLIYSLLTTSFSFFFFPFVFYNVTYHYNNEEKAKGDRRTIEKEINGFPSGESL